MRSSPDLKERTMLTNKDSYVYSVLLIKFFNGSCSTASLRFTNTLPLLMLSWAAYRCLNSIAQSSRLNRTDHGQPSQTSWFIIHSAVNICLFPPLFFYSTLYYTDVLSTYIVVLAYTAFLESNSYNRNVRSILTTITLGISAIFMRQTNAIWVTVFMAAMEWIRSCSTMDYKPFSRYDKNQGLFSWLCASGLFFARGNIHDPPLRNATVMGENGITFVVS